MVLIISAPDDNSTQDVIDWLIFHEKEYFVVYKRDLIESMDIKLCETGVEFLLEIDDKIINSKEITSFWYRRGHLSYKPLFDPKQYQYGSKFASYLSAEWQAVSEGLYTILESKRSIGSFSKEFYNNKINNLMLAQRCALEIPKTWITSEKKTLDLIRKEDNVITKSINNDIYYNIDNSVEFANFGPMVIEDTHLERMRAKFHHSLIQKHIDKSYELRIFIVHDKIYAAAIFSQNNPNTQLDSRVTDFDKPVRMTPYTLPHSIQTKLLKFMTLSGQNSASIDMIVTPDKEYIFLEANPVGQFGYLSFYCNYHVEHEMAEFLISN